ncbi:hypothetical protein DEU41_0605 [Bacillus sp. AG1163]|uniref:hypothetical protein n=1 Tax=Bacillus sp. AG1163 TaxID=2183999 RepID=UPI00106664C4|nr:hypothetical protein [Bacillus sp. AG1163]TDT83164.1 hypothetical protein DEU41_0605 [Bacillus sp. AG1163]
MNYKRTENDYLEELSNQSELLIDYCDQLDSGKMNYALPLAALIRVLVRDGGPNSKSLFYLLNKKETMKFCSTSNIYPDYDDILYLLTLITPAYKPVIDNGRVINQEPVFVPNLNRNTAHKNWISFDEWFNYPVFIYNKGSNGGLIKLEQTEDSKLSISRWDIINYFSNKSGGTHIAQKVNMDMYTLEKGLSSMEYQDIKPLESYRPGEKHVPGIPIKGPLHAAIRQIAHELILTIRKEFNIGRNYNPSHKKIIGYTIEKIPNRCIKFNPVTRQISIAN